MSRRLARRAAPMVGVLLGCALLGCGERSEAPPSGPSNEERARAVLTPFKQQLKGALSGAMAEGGPAAAINVCREKAPALAASAAPAGIRIGRTSHRLRNPDNAPEPWLAPILAKYAENPDLRESRSLTLPGGEFAYVEPIHAQALCLACHGEEIAPEVRARLRDTYPEDAAIGFREGDFRGLFWVTLAASS